MNDQFDIAIIGGGPAGCSAGLALARRGYRCLIVEKSDYSNVRVGETLPPAIRRLLTDLGVWDRFLDAAFTPAHVIASLWGEDLARENIAIFDPYGSGWHVDRRQFDRLLAQAAVDAGVTMAQGTRAIFRGVDGSGGWRLSLDRPVGACEASARVLVDATGRAAFVARRMGARRTATDRLVGLTGVFRPARPDVAPDTAMLVEAVEDGWWYSAPQPDHRLVVACLTDADLLAEFAGDLSQRFFGRLRHAPRTSARLRDCRLDCGPIVSAANSSRLDKMCGGNWVAIGDAAMAFDPLASQGVYRALSSGLKAAEAIDLHWGGNRSALKDYERHLTSDFVRYLVQRWYFYGLEDRWSEQEFWGRRHRSGFEKLEGKAYSRIDRA